MSKYNDGDTVRWNGFEVQVTRVRGISGIYEIEYRETSRSETKKEIVHEADLAPLSAQMSRTEELEVENVQLREQVAGMTPFQHLLLDATQKELAWRVAFSADTDAVLAGTAARGKGFMKVSTAAKDAYVLACVALYQALKGWVLGIDPVPVESMSDDEEEIQS